MTRRERRAVVRAMTLIHSGEDCAAGMDILAVLAYLPRSFSELLSDLKPVSVEKIAAGPNSSDFVIMKYPEAELAGGKKP